MAKSFVLRALKIFGLEEMLKLSEVLKVKSSRMKKAAGEELIVWSDEPEKPHHAPTVAQETDNVLQFKKHGHIEMPEPIADPNASQGIPQEDGSTFYSSEFMLWQRELSKDVGAPLLKKEAVKGYSRATEMYVVKTPTIEGKEKIRFASTNGVLVNKKQA